MSIVIQVVWYRNGCVADMKMDLLVCSLAAEMGCAGSGVVSGDGVGDVLWRAAWGAGGTGGWVLCLLTAS